MKKIFTTLSILIYFTSFSQMGYNWGENKKKGEPKYAFIQLNYQTDNFMACRPRVQWLLNDSPNLHKDLYIIGAEVYKKAAEKTQDDAERIIFQDSALFMYNEQIVRFGLEADGLNYMGLVAYNYLSQRTNQWDTLGTIYNRLVEVNDTNTFVGNIYTYLATNCVLKQVNKKTNKELVAIYQTTLRLLDYQKRIHAQSPEMISYLDQTTVSCNALFEQYFDANCETIEEIYDFDNLTIEEAVKALSFMEGNNCTASENYLKTLQSIYTKTKSPESTRSLADYQYKNKEYTTAINLYQEIINGEGPNETKGKSAYTLMSYYKNSSKEKARLYAQKSILFGYKVKEANLQIGDLYFNSLDECRTDDVVKTRALYIAAYNYYQKAGNTVKMANAKAQFPSKEEIFLAKYKIGQTINTGCWINENVVLQNR